MDSSDGETDGGREVGFDERAMYLVVRNAVEDAILGVIGTLLLLGIAFVAVLTGARMAITRGSTAGYALGGGIALFGFYLAAATLEIIPPVREWF